MRTIEEIVKEKEYFELTKEELVMVSDMAHNQEEFDQLKHLLTESAMFFNDNKISASDGMRDHIMEKLYPPTANESIVWYQSLRLFLFPPQKQFYQYPSFQLVSIFVILFGVFSLWENPFKNDELAQNNTVKKEIKIEVDEFDKVDSEIDKDLKPIKAEEVEIANEVMLPGLETEREMIEPEPQLVEEKVVEDYTRELEFKENTVTTDFDISTGTTASEYSNYSFDSNASVPAVVSANENVSVTAPKRFLNSIDIEDEIAIEESSANKDKYEAKQIDLVAAEVQKTSVFKEKKRVNIGDDLGKTSQKDHSVTEIKGLLGLFFEVK